MIKRISLVVAFFVLVIVLAGPALVGAGEGLTVLDSSASMDFPSQLQFHLSASSSTSITDIRLRYNVESIRFAEVISEGFIEFTPATTVSVDWSLDMVKIGGLPPGTGINYWWRIKDATGKILETPPTHVQFDDNRYQWKSASQGKVTIYWYNGEKEFAQGLVGIAQNALSRLAQSTGAQLEKPVRIYVYANSTDLRGAMIHPQEWTGGVTFTRYGIIALSIRPGDLEWAQQVIPHELTHLVINQVVLNPYSDLPTWLDEGLAVYMEGTLSPDLKAYLSAGISNNNLISVRSLCSPFSAYMDEAALSYGQSYSLVDYLISQYGQSKMLELLQTFKQGSGYDAAFQKVYGFDLDGLDAVWRKYIGVSERRLTSSIAVPSLVGG